jgi:hypothetical protein
MYLFKGQKEFERNEELKAQQRNYKGFQSYSEKPKTNSHDGHVYIFSLPSLSD